MSSADSEFEVCPSCDGSGLALNIRGEPDECPECRGNTVVPSTDVSQLLLRCPKCRKEMRVDRQPHDYPEAVRLEIACEECNHGDFAESCYFDAAGKHITRDPEAA